MPTTLNLVHFNDVYHISPKKKEPVGGAARFATAINNHLDSLNKKGPDEDHWVLFSGDVFSPSMESSITRGNHMVPIMNQLHIAASLAGNHDFDFGVPNLQKLIGETSFPWLLSNILDEATGEPPEGLGQFLVLKGRKSGIKVGIIGLVEKEWIVTIPNFPPNLKYHSASDKARDLSRTLRDPSGPHAVDIVVALTHMRLQNDLIFAQETAGEVDLVLGGHDHFYYVSKSLALGGPDWSRDRNIAAQRGTDPEPGEPDPRVRVVKSGTDFRELSFVKIVVGDPVGEGRREVVEVEVTRQEITSTLAEHSPTAAIIAQVTTLVSAKTSRPIGYTCTPLDGLFSTVRTRESNLGNLTADLMQHAYATCIPTGVDFAICNGGVLRGDAIIDKGVITLGDIMNFFPFEDPVVVIRISGARVLAALENSFAEYPKQEGRFPQVAGLRIEWDPKGEPGARVRKVLVTKSNGDSHHGGERQHPSGLLAPPTGRPAPLPSQPQGEPLDLEREYVLATREYMAQGGDGFTSLVTPPHDYIVDGENGMLISALFRRYFLGLKYVNAMRTHFEHECTTHKRVVEAAHVWRLHAKNRRARGLQAAAGPESGTESGTETPSGTEISESGSGAETDASSVKEGTDGAAHSTTKGGICDALTHSVKGRPCCLRGVHGSMAGEDVEDTKFMRKCEEVVAELGGEKSEEVKRESKETEEGQEEKGEEEDVVRWVREWASVGPLVEGRIVEVAEQ